MNNETKELLAIALIVFIIILWIAWVVFGVQYSTYAEREYNFECLEKWWAITDIIGKWYSDDFKCVIKPILYN
jgi:TM2 domain-containing membrane protein YozV